MKERFDRYQERLREDERRRLLAQASGTGGKMGVRSAGQGAVREAALRRWALSFGIAVTVIVSAAIVLIVRNHEERREASARGHAFEIVGQIPARPVPRVARSQDFQASGSPAFPDGGMEPFIDPAQDSVSFFTVHVGHDSYRNARRAIAAGALPRPEDVRVEEFVNAFRQGYPEFADADLHLFADGAPAPFGDGTLLLRVGIKAGRALDSSADTIVARNVKAAVTFDPRSVREYRLLGFQERKGVPSTRDVVAAGYEVAALYEIRPVKGATVGRIATLRVRYHRPGGDLGTDLDRPIFPSDVGSVFALAPARFRLDAAVARFAAILRSPSAAGRTEALVDLLPMVEELAGELGGDSGVGELAGLVERAAALSRLPG